MSRDLRKIALTCLVFFAIQLVNSQEKKYGSLTFNKAVNISGKQRMLTQRMGKIYLYLLYNPSDFKAKKDLKISKIIFEKQLSILQKNAGELKTKNRANTVSETWSKYKEIVDAAPSKKNAEKVINTNTTMLKQANSLVEAIILESEGSTGSSSDSYIAEEDAELKSIINKSGRQRMLSQRLALYYFANKPELKNKKTENVLKEVYMELDNALNDLLLSSFNNDRIDNALGEVTVMWENIKENKEKLFKQGYNDQEVYKLSNSLTKIFNRITNLYEKVKIE